jgi:NRPS condensation-like uncharacterized protein
MFEIDEPLCDARIIKSLQELIRLIPVLAGRPAFGLWQGHWGFREQVDTRRLVTRVTAKTAKETACLINNILNIPIYLDRDTYIKVTSIDGRGKHYLVVQIPHFAMDGEGFIHLLEQFAYCYRKIQKEPGWRPEEPLETKRSSWQIARHLKWRQFLEGAGQLGKISKDQVGTVIRGDFPGVSNTMHPEDPRFETLRIEPTSFVKVANSNKNKGYTVNDMLMATTMSTVCQWNRERGEICQKVSTRFGVNLRRWGKPDGTFANMSCVETLEESAEKLLDVRTALQSLKPKLDEAKQTMGLKDFWMLLLLAPIPECFIRQIGTLFRKSHREAQNKSHGMTNVGVIPESAGDLGHAHALSCSIIAPVSPRPNVMLAMTSFKGALTVNMSFSGKHMKTETAETFLQKWREQFMLL